MKIFAAMLLLFVAGTVGAAAEEGQPYELGPEDGIQIQVWQRPDLSGAYQLDADGMITLPLLGPMEAAGLTVSELGEDLERRYAILDPRVSEVLVTVSRYNSRHLNVVGEVRSPGRYTFRNMPNLWDAILEAGGAGPAADMSDVEVVRREDSGEQITISVDLSGGVEDTPTESLPELKPGDSIVIKSAQENIVTGDQIQILGGVRSPGNYSLRAAETLVEAIGIAGGSTSQAKLEKISLTRRTEDGVVVYQVDLKGYLRDGHPKADLELRPGDTVNIPESRGFFDSTVRGFTAVAALLSALTSVLVLTQL